MLCSAVLVTAACSPPPPPPPPPRDEWYTYRHDSARTGAQPWASALSDPARVGTLHVGWHYPPDGDPPVQDGFKASPIVVNDTVFIGSMGGYFYALDAASGAPKWQYPKASDPPLLGSCNQGGNGTFGQYGIKSSATYARIGGQDAVIFGAPDPSAEGGLGSARLFALTLSGDLIWKSDIVAHVSGCTPGSLSEIHERIAYSSPLVLGNKVYVGVHDAGDDPIQVGRVIAVGLSTGHIVPSFHFQSVGTPASTPDPQCRKRCEDQYKRCTDSGNPPLECSKAHRNCLAACNNPTGRGGGVWNSLATDGEGVYFTTGNTRNDSSGIQSPEPNPNHGLSMIRVDEENGNIVWAFQPVPYALDIDPDWAAGATVMSTSCGELIASVQKDGWSYAVNGNATPWGAPNVRWQFPSTGFPFTDFTHTDDHYKRPGAAWNDVLIITTGGEARADASEAVAAGYGKLHALNACATPKKDRVRWIADIPDTCLARPPSDPCHEVHIPGYSLGAPTVSGGIVFVGTDLGHLVVLGDPSVVPASQQVCSNVDYPLSGCPAPYVPVWSLRPLANVAMPDGGDIAGLRDEPALAKGRVFVGTGNGHVYMLETRDPQCRKRCEDQYKRCTDSGNPPLECSKAHRNCLLRAMQIETIKTRCRSRLHKPSRVELCVSLRP